MAEIKSRLPIEIVGIKTKNTSNGGIKYVIDDGKDHKVTSVLPGKVIKVDGDEVVISHKNYIKEDYTSIYVIDGKVKVKEGDEVSQSTVIGVTDEEIEFKVKHKGSYIDAKSFIGKTFNQVKGTTMSARDRARCIAKNIISVPRTAFGQKPENDPCAFYNDSEEPSADVEDEEPKDDEVKKDDKWEFFKDDKEEDGDGDSLLGNGTKMLGGETTEKLNEEISRIKELLRL